MLQRACMMSDTGISQLKKLYIGVSIHIIL